MELLPYVGSIWEEVKSGQILNLSSSFKTIQEQHDLISINNVQWVTINHEPITYKHDIANTFNAYFASIGLKLAGRISNPGVSPLDYLRGNFAGSFYSSPATVTDVTDCILHLKHSFPGTDGIRSQIINENKDHIVYEAGSIIIVQYLFCPLSPKCQNVLFLPSCSSIWTN